jgi:hypothetical protein
MIQYIIIKTDKIYAVNLRKNFLLLYKKTYTNKSSEETIYQLIFA